MNEVPENFSLILERYQKLPLWQTFGMLIANNFTPDYLKTGVIPAGFVGLSGQGANQAVRIIASRVFIRQSMRLK